MAACPQKVCSKLCQASAPTRDQLKYRAGAPATETDTTSFNLIGLWPCRAIPRDEPANRTCAGAGAESCFNSSNTTNNRKEKMSKLDPERGSTQCPQTAPPAEKQAVHLGLQVPCSDPPPAVAASVSRRRRCRAAPAETQTSQDRNSPKASQELATTTIPAQDISALVLHTWNQRLRTTRVPGPRFYVATKPTKSKR